MSVLSSTQKRRRRIPNKVKFKTMGDHKEFLNRIEKTLYYGKIPLTERFSLPVSELAAELYTNVKSDHGLERLCIEETAEVSRNACVSPCSLILALLYLERLKTFSPDYIDKVPPSELFVVSMMVASKFLHDDGEEDEVFNTEWAHSAGIEVSEVNRYEKDFLNAIRWEVFVNDSAFWTRLRAVERELARREGRRRGWFSYTELTALAESVDAWNLAHTLIMVSVVCLTSYAASVLTLVGSALITSQINTGIATISSELDSYWIGHSPTVDRNLQNIEDMVESLSLSCNSGLKFGDDTEDCRQNSTHLEMAVINKDRSQTDVSYYGSMKLWVPSSPFSTVSSLHRRPATSVDNISNRFLELFDRSYKKSDFANLIDMVISSMETERLNSYSFINYFVRKVSNDRSDVIIADESSDKFNHLNHLFRMLKIPS